MHVLKLLLVGACLVLLQACGDDKKVEPGTTDPVKQSPTFISPDKVSVSENNTTIITVQVNNSVNKDLTFTIIGGTDANLFDLDSENGVLKFKTAPDFETPDDTDENNTYQLSIEISDGELKSEQTFLITVTDIEEEPTVDNQPTAYTDTIIKSEDDAADFNNLLDNDTHAENTEIRISEIDETSEAGASLAILNDTTVRYIPVLNFFGSDKFEYTITDTAGNTSSTTVNLVVTPVNDAPVGEEMSQNTNEDSVLDISQDVVLQNALDPDDTELWISRVAPLSENGAQVTLSQDGSIIYTPVTNFSGPDNFSYWIRDDEDLESTAVKIRVEVNPINDRPITVNDNVSGTEDEPLVITPYNLLENDSDPDEDSVLIISRVTGISAELGTLELQSNGNILYTPQDNFNGLDSFKYWIKDYQGAESVAATVSINVSSVNDKPESKPDVFATEVGSSIELGDLSTNDIDVDNDNLSVTWVSSSSENGGSISKISNVNWTYQPAADFFGTDNFNYKVSDGKSDPVEGIVTVYVNEPGNYAPVATDDNRETQEDSFLELTYLLDNDSDQNGDDIWISTVGTQSEKLGTVEKINNTTLKYTPAENYYGEDSFAYFITDGKGGVDSATVIINVLSVNDKPQAYNDVVTTNEDVILTILSNEILSNDTDVDDETLWISRIDETSDKGNSVVLNPNGNITFTPTKDFFGTDSFGYWARDDEQAESPIAIVEVQVAPINDPPSAKDDQANTDEDAAITFSRDDLVGNDDDPDDEPLWISRVDTSSVNGGSVTLNDDNSVTFTPLENYYGADSFRYWARDAALSESGAASVFMTITSVNDAPTVNNDTGTTAEDTSVNLANLLDNDEDVENHDFWISRVDDTSSEGGQVVLEQNGSVSYAPKQDFYGEDTFKYWAIDSEGDESVAAIVNITVEPINDNPIAHADEIYIDEDQVIDINSLLDNDEDVDDPQLWVSRVENPSVEGGSVILTEYGTVSYTPPQEFSGTDSFFYWARDSKNAESESALVTLHIASVNDAPIANDDTANAAQNSELLIRHLLHNDTDVDSHTIRISRVDESSSQGGQVNVNQNGSVSYTPANDFIGNDSFSYWAEDEQGTESLAATVAITVKAAVVTLSEQTVPLTRKYITTTNIEKIHVDGNIAVVIEGYTHAAVHVYERNTVSGIWSYKTELSPSLSSAYDKYGAASALSGNTVVIGARDYNEGAIFVFERDSQGNWSEKFNRTTTTLYDTLGDSVAVQGDQLVTTGSNGYIFYQRDSFGNWDSGTVYGKEFRDNWGAPQKIAMNNNHVIVTNYNGFYSYSIPGNSPKEISYADNINDLEQELLLVSDGNRMFLFEKSTSSSNPWRNTNFISDFWGGTSGYSNSFQCSTCSYSITDTKLLTAMPTSNTQILAATQPVDKSRVLRIFTRDSADNWNQQEQLFDSSEIEDPSFGSQIAANDDQAVVLSPTNDLLHFLDLGNNTPPQANNDMLTVDGSSVAILPVLANDIDNDGHNLLLAGVQFETTAGGYAHINADGELEYSAPKGFVGTDFITQYLVSDGHGGQSSASVTLKVYQSHLQLDIEAGQSVNAVNLSGLVIDSFNETSENGVEIILNNNNTLSYTAPFGDENSSDNFEAVLRDSAGHLYPVTVSINITGDIPIDPNRFLTMVNGPIEDNESANAYYQAIDPYDQKLTLNDWKKENGFTDYGADSHAIYLNQADLGFGRDMYMIMNSFYDPNGNIASYVDNYPSLDDAINKTNIIATVAMEYGTVKGPFESELVAESGSQSVISEISMHLPAGKYTVVAATYYEGESSTFDLDLRPGIDFSGEWDLYSGGGGRNPDSSLNRRFDFTHAEDGNITIRLEPIRASIGTYLYLFKRYSSAEKTNRFTKFYAYDPEGARLNSANLDGRGEKFLPGVCLVCHGGNPSKLQYGIYPKHGDTGAGFLPWDLETYQFSDVTEYTRINQESQFKIFNSRVLETNPTPAAKQLIEGWYGGSNLPNATVFGSYVPPAWLDTTADTNFYLDVLAPNCRICHVQRSNHLDFATKDRFMGAYTSDAGDISRHIIFDKGLMPLAKRTYENFWTKGSGTSDAEKMADYLNVNIQTRKPLHEPQADIVFSGVTHTGYQIDLDASGSTFGETFKWKLLSKPLGSKTVIAESDTVHANFIPDKGGNYEIALAISDTNGNSNVKTITIPISNGSVANGLVGSDLYVSYGCSGCHGGIAGIKEKTTLTRLQNAIIHKVPSMSNVPFSYGHLQAITDAMAQ